MKVFIKNEVTLQNELVTIPEDSWAYAYALCSFGLVAILGIGAALLFV